MRFGPLTIELGSAEPEPAEFALDDVVGGAVAGSDGDTRLDLGWDWNSLDEPPDLIGTERWRTYNRMRRSDPAVRSNLWLYKLPARAAVTTVEAATSAPEDEEVAAATRWNFGLDGEEGYLDLSWSESIAQPLLILDLGCFAEEIIWSEEIVPWTRPDATATRLLRPISRLAPRMPSTFQEIEEDKRTGQIKWLRQNLHDTQPIPGDKLAFYTLDKEGNDRLGTSMLRSMYGPWHFKRRMMIAHAIGYDRWAAGLPVVRYPAGGGEPMKNEARKLGKNVRGTHERGYVVLENSAVGEAGWDFGIETGTIADPRSMLRYYDEQMGEAALAQAMSLGQTDTGSRAVGDVQIELLYLGIQAVADQIARDRRRQVVRRFVDVNFGPEYRVPKLKVSRIMSQSLTTLGTLLANLSSAGFNFTDFDTQNYMRRLGGLPILPDEVRATLARTAAAGGNVVPFVPREGSPVGFEDADEVAERWERLFHQLETLTAS